MILLSSYGVKISYSTGVWAISEKLVALPKVIPAESDTPNKQVWEHEDMLLDTGEPKRDKEDTACVIPSGPHVTACFNSVCHKKKGVGGFVFYGLEG